MADITFHGAERCIISTPSGGECAASLRLAQVRGLLECGAGVAVYVDGWAEPWLMEIDGDDLRAQCPTAPKVRPVVLEELAS